MADWVCRYWIQLPQPRNWLPDTDKGSVVFKRLSIVHHLACQVRLKLRGLAKLFRLLIVVSDSTLSTQILLHWNLQASLENPLLLSCFVEI